MGDFVVLIFLLEGKLYSTNYYADTQEQEEEIENVLLKLMFWYLYVVPMYYFHIQILFTQKNTKEQRKNPNIYMSVTYTAQYPSEEI